MKGLCQIIIGTGIQTLYLVGNGTARRQNQHLRISVLLPQRPQHRHPVRPRQIQIQQDKVVPLHAQKRKGFVSVIAKIYAVSKTPETANDRLTQCALIFNH